MEKPRESDVPYRLKFTVSEAEFLEAFETHWKNHKATVTTRTAIVLGTVCFVLGLPLGFAIGWLGWLIVILSALVLLLYGLRKSTFARLYRDLRKFKSEIEMEFSEGAVTTTTTDGVSRNNWSAYCCVFESREHILLYMSKNAFTIIPKKALNENTPLFIEFIKSKLEPNTRTAS